MAEYIEREALITELNNIAIDLLKDKSIQCSLAAGTVVDIKDNVVAKQPTADVVEVVRCKDCKFNRYKQPNGFIHCLISRQDGLKFREENDYCSIGERKNDNGEKEKS